MVPNDAQSQPALTNTQVAELLHETADLLEAQSANPFRIAAYRVAAHRLDELEEPIASLLAREGPAGLQKIEGIGKHLANHIVQIANTGRLTLLERLRGDFRVEHAFATVPDVGKELAHRIHDHLHIESLPELYAAAIDGRLSTVPGMGTKRVRAVRESLAGRFQASEALPAKPRLAPTKDVPVEEILDIDTEYRKLADLNKLPKVAPKRFNPTGAAWLPILHTQREDRHYTALYSNSAHAHEMGRTHDWVVIYRDDEHSSGQWTVITSQFGTLHGKRIVRGRENDCAKHYGVHQQEHLGTKPAPQ